MRQAVLPKIQRKFWSNLLGAADLTLFKDKNRRGLSVYQNAYFLRIRDALEEDFTEFATKVGEKRFNFLVKTYLKKFPSQHFSLRHMGKRFPSFVKKTKWPGKASWLVELAAYEWLKADLFDGADHSVLVREDLTQLTPEEWANLKIKFVDSLQILKLCHSVEKKKKMNKKENLSSLSVWRKQEEIYFCRLEKLEVKMIRMLQKNKSFGETCAEIAKNFNAPAEGAAFTLRSLNRWLNDEIIEKII